MRLGTGEILLLLVVVLFIFGPSKLPELGRSLAQFFGNFKREIKDVQKDVAEAEKHVKN